MSLPGLQQLLNCHTQAPQAESIDRKPLCPQNNRVGRQGGRAREAATREADTYRLQEHVSQHVSYDACSRIKKPWTPYRESEHIKYQYYTRSPRPYLKLHKKGPAGLCKVVNSVCLVEHGLPLVSLDGAAAIFVQGLSFWKVR